jgi:hypothetical protein
MWFLIPRKEYSLIYLYIYIYIYIYILQWAESKQLVIQGLDWQPTFRFCQSQSFLLLPECYCSLRVLFSYLPTQNTFCVGSQGRRMNNFSVVKELSYLTSYIPGILIVQGFSSYDPFVCAYFLEVRAHRALFYS